MEALDVSLVKGKREILNIPHFGLGRKATLAVVGPNGAGKSTLLQVLALLQQPTRGEIIFCGEAVQWSSALKYRRQMAVVFQESLLLNTTVYDNVAQGLKLRGLDRGEIKKRVDNWLERLNLLHLARRMPKFLSGGEAQKVNIARAMVLNPRVLFLDEPFTALDYPTRLSLLKEMGPILKESGMATLFVTHDYTEIPYICQDMMVMAGGKISYTGQTKDIFKEGFEKIFQETVVSNQ